MKINYNVTGDARKELAVVIGNAIGIEPVYMRMPTCAYAINNIILNRTGEMIWDERTDEETIRKATEAAAAAGFTTEAIEASAEEAQEAPTEADTQPQEEQPQESAEPETEAEIVPVELTVSLPLTRHNGNSLRNLINLVYTRAGLLNKALGTSFSVEQGLTETLADNENLRTAEDFRKALASYEEEHGSALTGLTITPEELAFTTLPQTTEPDRIKAFTELVAMMNKQAIDQKRIQAKGLNEENEKYALRIWLTRLGMNGPEHKTTRKILMENLSGHCAFRTDAEKERWQKRQAEKREALKAAKAAATSEEVAAE